MRSLGAGVLCLAVCVGTTRAAEVQEQPAPAPSPSPSPTPAAPVAATPATPEPPKIKVGGQIRLRPEYRNELKADAAGGTTDTFIGERARASVTVSGERVKAYVELQDARNWGTETSPTANDRNVDLHQAFVNLPDLWLKGLSLQVGRQELIYGDERLLGALDWATTARSFDAGVARYAWRSGSLDALGALVNDRKSAARGTGDVILSGAYARFLRGKPGRELDVYLLNLADGARIAAELGEPGGLDSSRYTTTGVRARYGKTTGFLASGEGVLQFGHKGRDDHSAHALALVAGYVFDRSHKPTLRFEFDQASGDGDAKDGKSKEFNNLFPTNHPFYGFADLLGWRNMQALRGTLALAPREGQSLSLDFHKFRLMEAKGAWKDASGEVLGQDPTGAAGRDIGTELDLSYRFPVRKELLMLLGYSAFFPGAFAETVRGDGTQSFAYAQLLFRF